MKSAFLLGCFLIAGLSASGQTAPAISAVVNSASGQSAVESGSLATIYGTGLATATHTLQPSDISDTSLPTTLANVTVLIDGKNAAIFYVSPGQINVQVPADTATGSVAVQVKGPNGTATGTATLASYAPGIFMLTGGYAAAVHNTGGQIVAPAGALGGSITTSPAVPGEALQVYGTGLGPTNPAVTPGQVVSKPAPLTDLTQLHVTVGGAAATVLYAGMVSPGLYQIDVLVPQSADGNQPIVATISSANSQSGVLLPIKNSVSGTISVNVTPGTSTLRLGATANFAAKVNNTSNQLVNWAVNGVAGGNSTFGTITAAGVYTTPAAAVPSNPAIMVTATSQENPMIAGNATINLQNPLPVVTAVTPTTVNPGTPTTLTVTGSGFVNSSVIYFAGAAQQTTFVSPTQLTATTTFPMPVGRLAAVKVTNPNPGSATSTPVAIPMRVANEQMPYTQAVRFLEMTTFGPTPQDVVNLQTMGQQAWLAAQFGQPASTWPDPDSTTENVTRLQTAFWNVALTGADQLRQRIALALGELMVVSAVTDTTFQQMVSYQRTLGDNAFGTYRQALNAMTLNAAMGDYLNMVNNAKATATTSANENYARESMQLFTTGLVQLQPNGLAVLVNGSTVPEYDQATVANMAKVMTGWTYGETPGYASLWTNMPYYFSPMIAFENFHDTTAKTLNFPIPCTIPAGGTAENDLSAAFDCVFQQTEVAPNISFRLIQHFVESSPSPAYVSRVAAAWQMSGGSLTNIITAILTDPEAQSEGSGKLTEPFLYVTNLLRALNATITAPDTLTAQSTNLGQTALSPPTVFSFFSPGYVIPNLTPTTLAPEFQTLNASTALARANFAWNAVSNAISSGISINLTNLQDLANNPANLVEAINQALFRGEIDDGIRSILTTAAGASSSLSARVRSAVYAAAASPQYQVQQ
ncbi:MAG TPA: DUF1800 family protein [Bryobacteraceae bacterium]